MRFQRILQQVYFRPWFATAETHATVARLVEARMANEAWDMSEFVTQRQPYAGLDRDGIAHIHILGTLGQGLLPVEKSCGCTDYDDVAGEMAQAERDGARGYFVRIDSGGGMCSGAIECGRAIAAAKGPKVAHTRTVMASAAYLLGVGCDQIYCTPSAEVGSIGVICPWVDESAAWDRMGIKFAPITNAGADLKSAMHGPSLTPEQLAYLQESVDDFGAQFQGHVRAHRAPSEEVFRAGCYIGARAQQYGLVDGLASEQQALELLVTRLNTPPAR